MSGIERVFQAMHMSASALKAERSRVDIIAKNIAHASTTRMPGTNEPYRREVAHFAPVYQTQRDGTVEVAGVKVSGVHKDFSTPFEIVHDPGRG
jgi:flagellar basal-body rod protein FlgC